MNGLAIAAAALAMTSAPDGAGALSTATATAWAAQQRQDGSFHDYVTAFDPPGHQRDAYGPGTLGGALILAGVRTRDPVLRGSGLRAVGYATAHPDLSPRGAFELMALAQAFGVARDALAGDPAFEALRPAWQQRLATARRATLGIRNSFSNTLLVEAVAVLEIQRLALPSADPQAIAGGDRARAAALARRLVNDVVPEAVAASTTRSRAGPLTMLADPPCNPPAYHALSLGLLARALGLLGPAAKPAPRRVLAAGARASWALMAPDGDVASFGRGQEQAWSQAFTGYGALAAARVSGAWRERFAAVAERALGRLYAVHRSGPWGLWIVPAFAAGPVARRGLDFYAAAAPYTGLTLLALEWAAAMPPAGPSGTIAADADGAYQLGRRAGCFVAQRAGRTWMIVKRAPAVPEHAKGEYTHDLRYDSGLIALQTRTGDGVWEPAMPPPPLTTRFDSAGPLLRVGGRRARAVGDADLDITRAATIVLPADFAPHRGMPLGRHARIRFQPTACGARIVVPARRGERWEYSAFFTGPPRRTGPRELTDGVRRVRFNRTARVTFGQGYASGLHARLTRARIRFAATAGAAIVIELCRASG